MEEFEFDRGEALIKLIRQMRKDMGKQLAFEQLHNNILFIHDATIEHKEHAEKLREQISNQADCNGINCIYIHLDQSDCDDSFKLIRAIVEQMSKNTLGKIPALSFDLTKELIPDADIENVKGGDAAEWIGAVVGDLLSYLKVPASNAVGKFAER